MPARGVAPAAARLGAALLLSLLWLTLLTVAPAVRAGTAVAPLMLDDRVPRVPGWEALTMLADAGKTMSFDQARAARERFARPTTARHTLGHRRDAVWVHLPLAVTADSDGQWILDIDYAPLGRIDLYLTDAGGATVSSARMGNLRADAERPLPSRSHAATLPLSPGQRYDLWLRIETAGGMIVPITLSKPPQFLDQALGEQMLQGLITGLGLCLLLYSLAQWLSLREPLLLKYAVLISGCLLFSVLQFGIGHQYLWGRHLWFEAHVGGLASVLASAGMFLFVEEALKSPQQRPWFGPAMKGGAAFLLLMGAAYAAGWIDLIILSSVVGTVGLLPALMGLPGALRRARAGDSVGWYFIAAWIGYFITTAVLIMLVKGRIEANFANLHAFQFGTTLDMMLFLRVLALRLNAIHVEARRMAGERDSALSMAHSDALTGLLNRRGLHVAIDRALPAATEERALAIYMIDLDGFKPVNDEHGHEIGDELLVAVARRLRAGLDPGDVIARLGGDEFVVLCAGQPHAEQSQAIGERLIAALREPFEVRGLSLNVGATIGYALAPYDSDDASILLKRADAAMYAGKQAGRDQVRRIAPAASRARDRVTTRW